MTRLSSLVTAQSLGCPHQLCQMPVLCGEQCAKRSAKDATPSEAARATRAGALDCLSGTSCEATPLCEGTCVLTAAEARDSAYVGHAETEGRGRISERQEPGPDGWGPVTVYSTAFPHSIVCKRNGKPIASKMGGGQCLCKPDQCAILEEGQTWIASDTATTGAFAPATEQPPTVGVAIARQYGCPHGACAKPDSLCEGSCWVKDEGERLRQRAVKSAEHDFDLKAVRHDEPPKTIGADYICGLSICRNPRCKVTGNCQYQVRKGDGTPLEIRDTGQPRVVGEAVMRRQPAWFGTSADRPRDIPTTLLGSQSAIPQRPEDAVIECVPNPQFDTLYVSRFTIPEFTSLCPVTSQPDFAHIVIDYAPGRHLIESKALKLYMFSFRNHGAFHEDCTITIAKRLFTVAQPHYMRVRAFWYPRGGIPIDVFWDDWNPKTEAEVRLRIRQMLPPIDVPGYRGRG